MVWIVNQKTNKNELDKIKDSIQRHRQTGINLLKYCGIITLKQNPVKIQKKLRSEWK